MCVTVSSYMLLLQFPDHSSGQAQQAGVAHSFREPIKEKQTQWDNLGNGVKSM